MFKYHTKKTLITTSFIKRWILFDFDFEFEQVSKFLQSVILLDSGANAMTRQIACELLLLLAYQRGSLKYLLDWINMALTVFGSMSGWYCQFSDLCPTASMFTS